MKEKKEKFKELEPDKKRFIVIIFAIVLILLFITVITSIFLTSENNNSEKTLGNLNNKGFATKKGNKVYITNSFINTGKDAKKGIYEVSSDNKTKLICEYEYVKSINEYKGYLYYIAVSRNENDNYTNQIVKMKPNGSKKTVVVDNLEMQSIGDDSLNISDNWIYYLNDEYKIEKVKTNGEKRQQIADEEISYFQVTDGYIYYTTRDNEFKRMKKDGSKIQEIQKGIDTFQVKSNNVYYLSNSNSHLMKLNLKSNEEIEIIGKSIVKFNIYGSKIYYATSETEGQEQAIYKANIDGKKEQKITDLKSENNNICIAGDWIYYTDEIENSPFYYTVYRIRTNGKDKQAINDI